MQTLVVSPRTRKATTPKVAYLQQEPDGTLRSRKFENALIRDPAEAARQALSIAQRGIVTAHDGTEVKVTAQTICIHGDTPGSVQIAAAVARKLRDADVTTHSIS